MPKRFDELQTPEELMQFMSANLKYGFVNDDDKVFVTPDELRQMEQHYKIRLGDDLIKNGYGLCWDQAELQRLFFEKNNIPHECYFTANYNSQKRLGRTHTFLLYKDGDKTKWFEHAFGLQRGIHEYDSKQQALDEILCKLIQIAVKEGSEVARVEMFKYPKVTKSLTPSDFIMHCRSGERLPDVLKDNGGMMNN